MAEATGKNSSSKNAILRHQSIGNDKKSTMKKIPAVPGCVFLESPFIPEILGSLG
ncbi:hypothetical protein T07_6108 [Trichinella nelsoni]|uniref:Uncharacterized protein n=1 Tax=Trichinella nelsoni TaxID=6336 RepID=A0A0V0RX70_9BILA|nr:hypothetical protein T07_6108 [Trichinella nelsoni]